MAQSRRRTRPGDATGRKDEELREKLTEEQKAEAERITMATAAEQAAKNEVKDYTKDGSVKPLDEVLVASEEDDEDEDELLAYLEEQSKDNPKLAKLAARFNRMRRQSEGDVESIHVEDMGDKTVVFTAAEDIEAMTYGAGNHFNFVAGQRYRVPEDLFRHLDSKGLVYH